VIQPDRIRPLGGKSAIRTRGRDFVLYWMQAAQRVRDNHALTYAVRRANESGLPLVVCFGLAGGFPEANRRHYTFMLQGLVEVRNALTAAGIRFVLTRRPPPRAALDLAPGAAVIVTDRGYLRVQKKWRETVARDAPCSVIQVETEVVVPVEAVSAKEEYAAATLRRKLTPLLETYLQPLAATALDRSSLETDLEFVAAPEQGGGQDHDNPNRPTLRLPAGAMEMPATPGSNVFSPPCPSISPLRTCPRSGAASPKPGSSLRPFSGTACGTTGRPITTRPAPGHPI